MIKAILLSCVRAFSPEFSHLIPLAVLLRHGLPGKPAVRVTVSEVSL